MKSVVCVNHGSTLTWTGAYYFFLKYWLLWKTWRPKSDHVKTEKCCLYLTLKNIKVCWQNTKKDIDWKEMDEINPANIRLDEDEYILINHRSSKDVFKTSWSRPIYSSCPYVFKTSSRHFQDVLPKRLQDVFKTCRKCVLKTFSRRFEDVSSK